MAADKNPFFKVEDFQRLDLVISGLNSTSQVRFKEKSIQLTQILEQGIWIEVPSKSCAMGHSLALDISGIPSVPSIHLLGVIEEIDSAESNQVRLKFRQFSQENWTKLLSYLSGKQDNINRIMKNSRK